jgi:hypothetical protein
VPSILHQQKDQCRHRCLSSKSRPVLQVMGSVALLTVGVIAATVTDDEVMGNIPGMLTGVVCVFATAGYNILAGSKQKQLGASALVLLLRATALLYMARLLGTAGGRLIAWRCGWLCMLCVASVLLSLFPCRRLLFARICLHLCMWI